MAATSGTGFRRATHVDPLPTSLPSALRAFAGLGPSKGRTAVFQCDCTNVRCTSEAARFVMSSRSTAVDRHQPVQHHPDTIRPGPASRRRRLAASPGHSNVQAPKRQLSREFRIHRAMALPDSRGLWSKAARGRRPNVCAPRCRTIAHSLNPNVRTWLAHVLDADALSIRRRRGT